MLPCANHGQVRTFACRATRRPSAWSRCTVTSTPAIWYVFVCRVSVQSRASCLNCPCLVSPQVHDSKSNNELRCIDLELAATGHAIFDIARAVASLTTQLSTTCSESEMREKALLLSYIQCMGLPAPSHHVLECLRVDCRLYYFTTRYLYLRHLPCCASSCQGILHAVHAYILRVRQSPSLCIELLRAIDPSAYVADTLGVRLHMLGSLACRPC